MQVALDFEDVLILPKPSNVTSRKEVDLMVHYEFPHRQTYTGIPILAANMKGVGSIKMASALADYGIGAALDKHENEKEAKNACSAYSGVFFTTGITDDLSCFYGLPDDAMVCLDVANGYQSSFLAFVEKVRKAHPAYLIMAGNVVTPEGVRNLAIAGADIIKIGLGSGSVCTTRIKTGVGVPQFSALQNCVAASRHWGVKLCSDGGCKTPGDLAKAYGIGADFVMLGGMLARANEAELDNFEGSSFFNSGYKTSEGKIVHISNKQPLKAIVEDILGGLRSACSYVGAKSLEDFIGKQEFIRVNRTHNNVFQD